MRIEFIHNPEAPPKWWVYFLREGTERRRNGKLWTVMAVDLGFARARGWGQVDE